ncbi:hypothetical protein ACH4UM_34015 [Streptomyces sp. NPDC020801]|uniref:hypothetical protein n=1 Tax=unclassified Streptomyces TaxID=2593676 RepID=UPI0037961D53
MPDTHDTTGGQAAALRLTTSAHRRLDGTTPSRDLADTVYGHIRLIQTITRTAAGDADRARLAAVGSEAASFAGWLAWDEGDHGSARSWYGGAVKAARTAGNALLTAYQIGTLAQFEAHAGNGVEALNLARRARRAGLAHLLQCGAVQAQRVTEARSEAAVGGDGRRGAPCLAELVANCWLISGR